jgi:hypothetical protein
LQGRKKVIVIAFKKNKAKRLELPYYRKEKTAEESLRKQTEKKT